MIDESGLYSSWKKLASGTGSNLKPTLPYALDAHAQNDRGYQATIEHPYDPKKYTKTPADDEGKRQNGHNPYCDCLVCMMGLYAEARKLKA